MAPLGTVVGVGRDVVVEGAGFLFETGVEPPEPATTPDPQAPSVMPRPITAASSGNEREGREDLMVRMTLAVASGLHWIASKQVRCLGATGILSRRAGGRQFLPP
jgi:hypothetical protein